MPNGHRDLPSVAEIGGSLNQSLEDLKSVAHVYIAGLLEVAEVIRGLNKAHGELMPVTELFTPSELKAFGIKRAPKLRGNGSAKRLTHKRDHRKPQAQNDMQSETGKAYSGNGAGPSKLGWGRQAIRVAGKDVICSRSLAPYLERLVKHAQANPGQPIADEVLGDGDTRSRIYSQLSQLRKSLKSTFGSKKAKECLKNNHGRGHYLDLTALQ